MWLLGCQSMGSLSGNSYTKRNRTAYSELVIYHSRLGDRPNWSISSRINAPIPQKHTKDNNNGIYAIRLYNA